MTKTAKPLERGIIPSATRRKIIACLRQGHSLRKAAMELNVPIAWVRRIHALQNDEVALRRRRAPEDPSQKSIARQETDQEITREQLVAINAAVLADFEREYGSPGNCPSLAQARERPEERLRWRQPLAADLTALIMGDPSPSRSALAMRGL